MTTKVKVGVIAENAVDTAQIVESSVTSAVIAGNAVVSAKIAANQIITSKIASNAIESGHITSGEVTTAHLADSAITTDKIAANAITLAKITSGTLTADSLADNSITGAKIAQNSIDSSEIVTGSIDTVHIADSQVTNAKLANSSVTVNSNEVSLGSSITLDTDDIGEGSTNQYFTNARAQGAITVTDAGGDGSLGYSGGTITYTGPSAAETRAHFSAGTGVGLSSGEISIGQAVATTDSPTFNDLTLDGDLNLTGDLNITGDLNTLTVTDLDVVDKTITLGAGQVESASDGSGIIVDGSNASILWDETNDEWDFNKAVNVTGNTYLNSGNGTGAALKVGGEAGSGIKTQYVFSGSTQHNWQLGFATHASQVMSITPSSAVGNTTFTTPILNLDGANSRVGIGTTNPQHEIDLTKTLTTIGQNPTLQVKNSWSTEGNNVGFDNKAIGLFSAGADTVITKIQSRFDSGANIGEIGTETNHDFLFTTNNTERMRIDSSGNVGIGDPNPSFPLDVSYVSGGRVRFKATTGHSILELSSIAGRDWQIESKSDGQFHIVDTDAAEDRLVIDTSGNVGIGETSINHKLDVAGNISTTGELYLETQNKKIAFNAGNSSSNKIGAWDYSSGSPVNPRAYIEFLGVDANQDTDIVFHTSTDATSVTEVMRVSENQRVGIGTDTPQRKLTVTGSADSPSDNTGIFSITDGTGVNTDAKIQLGITSNGHGYIHTVKPGTDIKSLLLAPAGGNGRVGIGISSTPSASLHIQPSNSDSLATSIFTRQNNAAGTDGNTFALRNDAANNFVEMNSGGTNNGGYKFYTGTFSGDPALTIVGAGATGGYVGVGTDTPQTLFETATTGTTTNRLTVSSANEFSQIWVEDDDLQGILWKDGSDFTFGPAADTDGSGWGAYITIEDGGNVGIGDVPSSNATGSMSPRLFIDNNLGDGTLGLQIASYQPSIVLSDKSAGLYNYKISHDGGIFAIGYEGGSAGSTNSFTSRFKISSTGNVGIGSHTPSHPLHIHGGNAHTNLVVSTNDNYKSEVRMMEDAGGSTHGGFIRYDGNGDYVQIGHYNSGTEMMGWSMDDAGNIAVGATNASGHFEVHGGRMGIVSTDSSWEQFRVCNTSTTGEAGIAIFNGANSGEFLSDTQPIFSNAFTLAINPYGCGSDTLAIGHGNLGDSIWHIDGSGNFGYGPNTENPVSYYEISKNRPNVNAPSDYELKLTLNTYGYVGSGYKLAMLQWLGGDTAGAQDNFYAGIGSTALDGANNSEEGSLDFYVRNGADSDDLAMQIIGKAGTGIAGGGQHAKSVMFPYQGIAIDRVWAGYPGISVFNSSDAGTNQSEFRFHGTNSSSAAYPGTSGSDFSVNVRADGSFISTSDGRAKTNITTIDNALDTVKQLTGKRFQKINRSDEPQEHLSKNGYKFGFIAQEVEDIIPEAVQYHADEDDGTNNWNSAYAMDYSSVVALLVNAIKEQDVVIQDLKSRIEALEE